MCNLRTGCCSLDRDSRRDTDIHRDNRAEAHIDTGMGSSYLSDRDSNMDKNSSTDMAYRMHTNIYNPYLSCM